MLYVDVILPLPLDGLFTYSVPQEWEAKVCPYVRAKVPFGITKTHTALIVRSHNDPPQGDFEVKSIISIIDDEPILLPQQYDMWQWISKYYMSPMGDVMQAALPHGIKKEETYRPKTEVYIRLADQYKNEQSLHNAMNMLSRSPKQMEVFTAYLGISGWAKLKEKHSVSREELTNVAHCTTAHVKALVNRGFLQIYDKEIGRLNSNEEPHPENIKTLSPAQQEALDKLRKDNGAPSSAPILFHGVTSSGKTEVYIHLIQEAIDKGLQVLYLLPEIALTVQITSRLKSIFGNRMGIYHSKYSDAERVEIWQRQLSDAPYDIILGVRSSVFLPFQRLGLIIVDEEHETSFKQQDPSPRYHARSVALMMAKKTGANVILGTATPSAETYYKALQGKYRLVELKTRYKDIKLPHIEVVNTKDLRRRKLMRGMLSPALKKAVVEALRKGEQAIIFHNRRGFSPVIECHQCGWSPKCPNCDVSLTYHKTTGSLTCHYCGHTYPMPRQCPDCENSALSDRGAGTEKIEDMIVDELRESGCDDSMLHISRMDLDTTRTRNAYERIINDFSNGKKNLLIGTQMVTKGLDFAHVSVVGIISAETMLNKADFRAHEQAFTMITQVAGRAGRQGQQGQVFLQTAHPELPVIKQITNNDYEGFFKALMTERQLFRYPPFCRLIYIYLKHRDNNTVNTAAIELGSRLRQCFADNVLGPDKPAVARIKQLFIRKIVLKAEPSWGITPLRHNIRLCTDAIVSCPQYKNIMISFDVDPL